MQLELDPAKFWTTLEGAECLDAPFEFLDALLCLSSDCVHTDINQQRLLPQIYVFLQVLCEQHCQKRFHVLKLHYKENNILVFYYIS